MQQPPGLQRPPVEGEAHESQRQKAQEAAARELARAAAARAAAAAAAAMADESEVKRLSLPSRAVIAFRKPEGIAGWKDVCAMTTHTFVGEEVRVGRGLSAEGERGQYGL